MEDTITLAPRVPVVASLLMAMAADALMSPFIMTPSTIWFSLVMDCTAIDEAITVFSSEPAAIAPGFTLPALEMVPSLVSAMAAEALMSAFVMTPSTIWFSLVMDCTAIDEAITVFSRLPAVTFPAAIAEAVMLVKAEPLRLAKYVPLIAGILPVVSTIPTLPEPAVMPPATSRAAAPVSERVIVAAETPKSDFIVPATSNFSEGALPTPTLSLAVTRVVAPPPEVQGLAPPAASAVQLRPLLE